MRNLRLIGNIDDELVERAAPKGKPSRAKYLKWALPLAASLFLAAIFALNQPNSQVPAPEGGTTGASGTGVPSPSLSFDRYDIEACFEPLEDWRGIGTDNFRLKNRSAATEAVLAEETTTLKGIVEHSDAFVPIGGIIKTSQEEFNMQTSIGSYAGAIGNPIYQHSDHSDNAISVSLILLRQRLMDGYNLEEPNNLLVEGHSYILPVKFNMEWQAYEVIGDNNALFELDSEGHIMTHSQDAGLSQYDGMTLESFLTVIKGLYEADAT